MPTTARVFNRDSGSDSKQDYKASERDMITPDRTQMEKWLDCRPEQSVAFFSTV